MEVFKARLDWGHEQSGLWKVSLLSGTEMFLALNIVMKEF